MKQYISESQAIYNDVYHSLFSEKLAEWAISHMTMRNADTGEKKHIRERSLDEFRSIAEENSFEIQDEFLYTAWYLYHMAVADYPKTLKNDAERISFVEETLCDPDGCPENVLGCFESKMCNAGIPIYWELYM